MVWKKVNNTDPGDATHFGGDDRDKISDLFSDVINVDLVQINSTVELIASKFKIRDLTDETKEIVLDVSAITTGTTRTITWPNSNLDFGSFPIANLDTDPLARANHTGTQLLSTISDVTITAANLNILDDAADTALHFHNADRARAVHTGTQVLSTISDVSITATNLNILDDGVDTTLHFHDADRARAVHTGTQDKSTISGLPWEKSEIPTVTLYTDEMTFKTSVRIATEVNDTLSGLAARDGITPIINDRVLVKAQSTASANGIYDAAVGAWTRSTDYDNDAKATSGTLVFVQEGTANADKAFQLTTNEPITLGTTGLTFAEFGAGEVLTWSGNHDANGFALLDGRIADDADATKILDFNLAGMTTGIVLTLDTNQTTAQTLQIPNLTAGDTLVLEALAATLTNKTIDLTDNTITGTLAEFNAAVSDATLVDLDDSQTLLNKILISTTNRVDIGTLEAPSEAQGDIFFRNATVWTRLPKGTDNQALVATATTVGYESLTLATHVSGASTDLTNSADIVLETIANTYGDFDQTFQDNRIKIRNAADTFQYTIQAGALTANQTLNLPLITGTQTLVVLGQSNQRFTARVEFENNDFAIMNPANTFRTIFNNSAILADRVIILPLLTGNDTMVTEAHIQTLTNKTIAGGSNTITQIGFSEVENDLILGAGTVSAASGDFVLISDTTDSGNLKRVDANDFLGGASLPVVDTTSIAEGSGDNTKEVRFEVDGNTTGIVGILATAFTTAKTVTFPDATDTLVGKATVDIFTNKTYDADAAGNVLTNVGDAEIQVHTTSKISTLSKSLLNTEIVYDDQANVYGDFDQTLRSNRLRIANPANSFFYTFTGATIAGNRVVTLPLLTAPDTFVMEAFGATLTNKTIAFGSNTVSGTFAEFNTAVTDATLVDLDDVQTLLNKTLDSTNTIQSGAYDTNSIADGDISSHTSTKITINAKGQLNSDLLYTDEQTFKTSVRIATEVNDSLSGLAARDGVTPVAGDRVLAKAQTATAANGIYDAAVGAWTRSTDYDTDTKATSGTLVLIQEGTANADKAFQLTTNEPITLGTTGLTFAEFGAGGAAHDLLSATHSDTATATRVEGDIVFSDATEWNRLARGTDNQALVATASTVGYESLTLATHVSGASTDLTDTAVIVRTDQINTYGDFVQTFKDNALHLENPAGTVDVVLQTSAEITSDRILTIPLLGANRTMVVTGLASQIVIGTEVTGASTALTDTADIAYLNTNNTYAANTIQTFTPDTSNAGINVGSFAGEPTGAVGEIVYDSTAGQLKGFVGAAWVNLGQSGSEVTSWTADHTTNGNSFILTDDSSPPAGSVISIYAQSSELNFNTSIGNSHQWRINTGVEMALSATELTLSGTAKNITLIGSGAVGFIQMAEITDPAAGTASGKFYVKDVGGISRPFYIGEGLAATDLSTGTEVTTWTADHSAGANDLTNLKNLLMTADTAHLIDIERTAAQVDGYVIGEIRWRHPDNAAAQINYGRITTVMETDLGTEDGSQHFFVTEAGVEEFEWLRFNNQSNQNVEFFRDITVDQNVAGSITIFSQRRREIVADGTQLVRNIYAGIDDASNNTTYSEWAVTMENDDNAGGNEAGGVIANFRRLSAPVTYLEINIAQDNEYRLNMPTAGLFRWDVNDVTQFTLDGTEILGAAGKNIRLQASGAAGFVQMGEITDPAAGTASGKFYVKDVGAVSKPFFIGEGQAAVDLSTGIETTTWTADHDTGGFSLFLTNDATPPAGTQAAIYLESSLLNANVAATFSHQWRVNDVVEMALSATALDLQNNNLTIGSGTINFLTAGTSISEQTSDMIFDVSTGDIFSFDIAGVPEVTISNTQMDLTGLSIVNATIDGDLNTFVDINETQMNVSVGVSGTILTSTGVGSPPTYQSSAGGEFTGAWTANHNQGGSAFSLEDARFADPTDDTKTIQLNLAGMTTAIELTISTSQSTAQTLTIPNTTGADDFVLEDFAQTLTNKTINTASNTITVDSADVSDLASSAVTFTNKTLISNTNRVDVGTFETPSEAEGDVIFRNATVWTRLPRGTDNQALVATASTVGYESLTLATHVSGASTDLTNTADIVLETIANTYGAGNKQSFVADTTTAGININNQVPSTTIGGDIWRATDDITYRNNADTADLVLANASNAMTFTNKTIDGDDNTIIDINETQMDVSVGVSGTVLTSTGVGSPPTYQTAAGGEFTGAWTANHNQAGSGFALLDLQIGDTADPTKRIDFTLDGMTTAITLTIDTNQSTAQTLTIPNTTGADDFVLEDFVQTLTNKTIAGGSNTITGLTNAALTSGTFAAITGIGAQSQALDMNSQQILNIGTLLEQQNATGVLLHDFFVDTAVADGVTIGSLRFRAQDGTPATQNFAEIRGVMEDDLAANEEGSLQFFVTEAGVHDVEYMRFNSQDAINLNEIIALRNIEIQRTGTDARLTLSRPEVVSDLTVIASIRAEGFDDASANQLYVLEDYRVESDAAGSESGGYILSVNKLGSLSSQLRINVADDNEFHLRMPTGGLYRWDINSVTQLTLSNTVLNAVDSVKIQEAGVNISPIGVHDIWIHAGALEPTTTSGAGAKATREIGSGGNQKEVAYVPFTSTTADEIATFQITLPRNYNNGTIDFIIQYMSPTAFGATDTVTWSIAAVTLAQGELISTAFGTAAVLDHTPGAHAIDDQITSTAITVTPAATPVDGEQMYVKVMREGTAANDDFAGVAQVIGIIARITTDTAVAA